MTQHVFIGGLMLDFAALTEMGWSNINPLEPHQVLNLCVTNSVQGFSQEILDNEIRPFREHGDRLPDY